MISTGPKTLEKSHERGESSQKEENEEILQYQTLYIYNHIYIVFSTPHRDSTDGPPEHSHDNELSGVRISFHHQKQCGSGQPMVRALG